VARDSRQKRITRQKKMLEESGDTERRGMLWDDDLDVDQQQAEGFVGFKFLRAHKFLHQSSSYLRKHFTG